MPNAKSERFWRGLQPAYCRLQARNAKLASFVTRRRIGKLVHDWMGRGAPSGIGDRGFRVLALPHDSGFDFSGRGTVVVQAHVRSLVQSWKHYGVLVASPVGYTALETSAAHAPHRE